mmetsp:Transcript_4056/g.8155  ORF Transcript_4056/g.8155 Transcript_4056/m.8155 type:complete len:333 (-) Transcript_4056:146-1144(-)
MSRSEEKWPQRHPPLPPPVACLFHYALVGPLSVAMHDRIVAQDETNDAGPPSEVAFRIGIFFGVYWLWLVSFRLYTASSKAVALSQAPAAAAPMAVVARLYTTEPTSVVWYEIPWLCNMTLAMGAWGLVTNRTSLALAYGLTVAIDQLLWYVDGLIYVTTGKTVVGVFRHMLLPTARWYHHLTTWHHVWTLPLLMVAATAASNAASEELEVLRNETYMYRYYRNIWLSSAVVMTLNVLSSRFLTPFAIVVKAPPEATNDNTNNPPGRAFVFYYYLNVNLSYEVWKDLSKTISFLRIQDDRPSTPLYLWRLLSRWMFLNTVILVGVIGICWNR